MDNARLYARERNVATRAAAPACCQRCPACPGFTVVTRYLPAATGPEVGGDWMTSSGCPAGGTAFVIGDVMGRGVPAATTMGQIRTAVRAYALLDLPPAEVLRHGSKLAATMSGRAFITCVYAVHDPVDETLTYANAGHRPAVTSPRRRNQLLGGAARHAAARRREVPGARRLPPGLTVFLYTDGLIERRGRNLPEGILGPTRHGRAVAAGPGRATTRRSTS